MLRILVFIFMVACSTIFVQAQDDPILFTIEDTPIHVSEFDYIYSKNSGQGNDYSLESLEEYLDLYVKFKLKVQKAKELKMDTIVSLQKELDGYRKQLAKSYLTDKEVTERLIRELYERQQYDVELRQILFKVNSNARPAAEKNVEKKAWEVYELIEKGMDFDAAIQKYSEDRFSSKRRGSLGFMTAMFPTGFYEVETAAYSMQPGEISEPVRSKLGYHIVQLVSKRPARGEVEVAHILVRDKIQRKQDTNSKDVIDSVYMKLESGADFAELAREYSEDESSAEKGGYIGFFGINKYEVPFENAAFSLENDGDYSKPIKSKVGWHIIKRISKKEVLPFEDIRINLKNKILRDSRYETATESLVKDIKESANFKENKEIVNTWKESLTDEFFKYNWTPTNTINQVIFNFGDQNYTLAEFQSYTKQNARDRIRMERLGIDGAIEKLYAQFVEDRALKYEESQLENKYPDFKSLMREYEEGILLFEVTKDYVWDKAGQDTTGLKKFFESSRENYMWKERAEVKEYTLTTTDEKVVNKFARKAKRSSDEKLKKKFGEIFTVKDKVYERGSKELSGFPFKAKSVSMPRIDQKSGTTTIRKIVEITPTQYKTLKEARGYVEADYQDKLEREWIKSLRQQYEVEVNEDVLKSLVK